MNLRLQQRTALVTGASEGIGAGMVRVLAAEGAAVVATARRGDRLQALADEIERRGDPRPRVIAADVTDARALAEMAAQAGPIDILINAVGAFRPTALDEGDRGWDDAFALNFTPARRLTQALLPGMQARGWGRVINISGSMEPRSLSAASAAKGALHLWAKGLACEVAAQGVTVNTLQPGRINSEQIRERLYPTEAARQAYIAQHIPIGYFGEPEDMAHLAAFLCSPLARYITGAVIPVDGGLHYFAH
ncbi:SDR family NAD(P)-dependent oxidoreductase [Serratia ficaria]|uniref:3-oxoacyl-[acyl-carrier-protein] reductase FabG n=1 Tax=Serratia ficaria TaxID=61651 RepID=A0A240A948_SERFI|nr:MULTISPECIES: SDR family NAD(P)-dependent oxidoreductase [Serratia]MEE4483419.1 SDR family NAD(P)-dependent oxidoreductase [Serratia ficaria]REF42641.1 3-oxoacyl-[acyl-carrier protein] reductase [Serratia ficaria]CAI0909466.1 3-oxoacyl-[acyl-carrier-protein] reductase FabG [Serratia ficaria]CAI0915915.1 3-oxoacyl-[acyl-carrier-protein] reductase FabG [Serratia ficaria]CAI1069833.1 3-oxoacyl-[acyl-carrier-protein] reductase FabG [Serratia ficaria]